jgi:hypothetical protein
MYVHPYGDDLSYAFHGTHSALGERLLQEYRTWNGRYFSSILVLRGPLVLGFDLGLKLYRAVPVVLMVLLVHAAYTLLRTRDLVELSRLRALLAALGFLAVLMNLIPHEGEGLYWYTGAVTYFLPCILILHGAIAVLRYRAATGVLQQVAWAAWGAVLLVALSGSNEVVMVYMLLATGTALFLTERTNSAARPLLLAVFIVALVCAAVVYFAPGNALRSGYFEHTHEPLRTLAFASAQTLRFIGRWSVSPAYLLASLLVLAWAREAQGKALAQWSTRAGRWLALALPITAVFVAMALPYWATGILGQHRTANLALFVFLPLSWWALVVWDVQVFRPRGWAVPLSTHRHRPLLLALLALSLLFTGQDGRVTSDLVSGRAARYDAQCMHRYDQVRQAIRSGASELELEPLNDPPKALSVLDLYADPQHWMNTSLALYFGGDSLHIRLSNGQGR